MRTRPARHGTVRCELRGHTCALTNHYKAKTNDYPAKLELGQCIPARAYTWDRCEPDGAEPAREVFSHLH